jgi:hypothetical protein
MTTSFRMEEVEKKKRLVKEPNKKKEKRNHWLFKV